MRRPEGLSAELIKEFYLLYRSFFVTSVLSGQKIFIILFCAMFKINKVGKYFNYKYSNKSPAICNAKIECQRINSYCSTQNNHIWLCERTTPKTQNHILMEHLEHFFLSFIFCEGSVLLFLS